MRLTAPRLVAILLGAQACALAGTSPSLPAWVRVPAEQRGTTVLFTGEGEGASEAEARAAALRAAREEAARARNVRVEAALQTEAGQVSVGGTSATALGWQRVVTATREATDGVLTRAVPFGPAVVVRRAGGFNAWARIAVQESDLFPWMMLESASAEHGAPAGRGLRDTARELEARGELPLAEFALREAAQASDSDDADAAVVDLAWLLQRQGRDVEALRLLRAAGLPGRLSGPRRESAERVARLVTPEPRRYEDCTEELLALARGFASEARLRLRLISARSAVRAAAPEAPAPVDVLLDLPDEPREVAVLWIDTTGIRLEFSSAGSAVSRGAHALTLAGTRGLGEVAVVAVAAASVAPLERLRAPGEERLVRRWHGGDAAGDAGDLLAFRGLTQAVGITLRADPSSAAAQVRLRLD